MGIPKSLFGGKGTPGKKGAALIPMASQPPVKIMPTLKAHGNGKIMPLPKTHANGKIMPTQKAGALTKRIIAPNAYRVAQAGAAEASSSSEPLLTPAPKTAPINSSARRSQRMRGRVAKWQAVFGWITPLTDLPEDLEPLLIRFNNNIYVNWRNIQQGVTIEGGSTVDFLVEADDYGLVAMDVGTGL